VKNIKYCGNCNPDVNPKDVKKALEALFTNTPREDVSIMVNGCSRACLTKRKPVQKTEGKTIILSSQEVMKKKP
jgi:hypothetical protein